MFFTIVQIARLRFTSADQFQSLSHEPAEQIKDLRDGWDNMLSTASADGRL
jgi:hypothetical protein